jgi:hypothetical protein
LVPIWQQGRKWEGRGFAHRISNFLFSALRLRATPMEGRPISL